MSKRTPKNYDGTATTTHHVGGLLSKVLMKIDDKWKMRPDLIIACWPQVIGQTLAPMTRAVAFSDGVLHVKVKNSTLYSLLCSRDKASILQALRNKFPKVPISNIVFTIG